MITIRDTCAFCELWSNDHNQCTLVREWWSRRPNWITRATKTRSVFCSYPDRRYSSHNALGSRWKCILFAVFVALLSNSILGVFSLTKYPDNQRINFEANGVWFLLKYIRFSSLKWSVLSSLWIVYFWHNVARYIYLWINLSTIQSIKMSEKYSIMPEFWQNQ